MSQQSTSICTSILMGKCRREEYAKAEWQGSAVSTWDFLHDWFDASQIDPSDRRLAQVPAQRYRIDAPWSAYMHEVSVVGSQVVAYKVGITSTGDRRLIQHDNNPLLSWNTCRSVLCGSKSIAEFVENYMLAASAHAGMWLGGEWIGGCRKSKKLAVGKSPLRRKEAVA